MGGEAIRGNNTKRADQGEWRGLVINNKNNILNWFSSGMALWRPMPRVGVHREGSEA